MQFWPSFTAWTIGAALTTVVVVANYDQPPSHQPTPAAISAVTDADINWYYETAFGQGFDASDRITPRPRICPNRSTSAAAQASLNHRPKTSAEDCSENLRARHRRAQEAIASFTEEYTRIQARYLKSSTYQKAQRDYQACMSRSGVNNRDLTITPVTTKRGNAAAGTPSDHEHLRITTAHSTCSPALATAEHDVYLKTRTSFDAKHEIAARESLRYALAEPNTG